MIIEQKCPCCGSVDCYEQPNTSFIECGDCYLKITKQQWIAITEKIKNLEKRDAKRDL